MSPLKEAILNEWARPGKKSFSAIARKVGCSIPYVHKTIKRTPYDKLSRKQAIKIAFLWGQDIAPFEIGRMMDLSVDAVIHFLQKEGLLNA